MSSTEYLLSVLRAGYPGESGFYYAQTVILMRAIEDVFLAPNEAERERMIEQLRDKYEWVDRGIKELKTLKETG